MCPPPVNLREPVSLAVNTAREIDIMAHRMAEHQVSASESQSVSPAREILKLDVLVSRMAAAADDNTPPARQTSCLAARKRLGAFLATTNEAAIGMGRVNDLRESGAVYQARSCSLAQASKQASKRGGRP